MRYQNIVEGIFIERQNRFVAKVLVDGKKETVHVKNTGRCRELLIPGCKVYLNAPTGSNRKTKYDLVAVKKLREGSEPLLINMDSSAPNEQAAEWLPKSGLFAPDAVIRREVTFGNSRFDFAVFEPITAPDSCISDDNVITGPNTQITEEKYYRTSYLEVKGVTLENDGVAMFPDAPTERGLKHVRELTELAKKGIGAYILFVIQMKGIRTFSPNYETHKAFGDALKQAEKAGVKILAYDSIVAENATDIDSLIEIKL